MNYTTCCFVCQTTVYKRQLNKVYLSELSQTEQWPSLEQVSTKSETLTDRLNHLKTRFAKFEYEVNPTVIDLREILCTLNEKLDIFQELKNRNEQLGQELNKMTKSLEKDLARRKEKYEKINQSDSEQALKVMVTEIKTDIEKARQAYERLVKGWKSSLLDYINENLDKCELITKIGNEPRRYIRETFDKLINRLYCFEI